MIDLILIGANNPETKRVVDDINKSKPTINIRGFLDNDEEKIGSNFIGYPVLGGTKSIDQDFLKPFRFVNLITRDMKTRFETSLEVAIQGGEFQNLIHTSVNTDLVELGVGNYFQENVVIQAGVKIGNNSSIHIGSLIGHESEIGNSTFVAHGCNLSGFTILEDGVFLGAGVTTVPQVTIGKWSVIGAGSVVVKDIPPYSVAVGNPAKIIKNVEINYKNADIFR